MSAWLICKVFHNRLTTRNLRSRLKFWGSRRVGQGGDLSGIEELGNERSLIEADQFFQVQGRPGHFVAGDIVRPHLLTTAIGQASVAADSIDHFLKTQELVRRPKVDVHHFSLLNKLHEQKLAPQSTIIPRIGEPTRQIL
ncbi:MAG: hypothetical protein CM1200mP18_21750 [Gammaproteobacteria bacterium]|nr:MAG: hypothetical protein CM1200mP18_21750 [Gammaproteobacteria bacterium]